MKPIIDRDELNDFESNEEKQPEIDYYLTISDCLVLINKEDKKNVLKALKLILEYSNQAGINLSDVRQLLNDLYENI